ncbi:hypothetical protein ACLGIH_32980 [Streptomyces sp. HMX87]|uniref:hypothetical protein n=1 Tax=Streptomyces sp. HMX87 TaxID=3390849 RepID=UPI003A89D0C6
MIEFDVSLGQFRRQPGAVTGKRAVDTRTGGQWLVGALTASAVLTSGCTASVDTDELPGVYRNEATGGEILLGSDRTFSATDVSTGHSGGPAGFGGRWEVLDNQSSSDFIYLSIDDGGLGRIDGIQLYTEGQGTVYFRADPDGPPALELTEVAAP